MTTTGGGVVELVAGGASGCVVVELVVGLTTTTGVVEVVDARLGVLDVDNSADADVELGVVETTTGGVELVNVKLDVLDNDVDVVDSGTGDDVMATAVVLSELISESELNGNGEGGVRNDSSDVV